MICPKCKCVYQEGVTECSDCHVPLVEMPREEEPQLYAMRPVKLIGVQSQLESDLLMEMLKAENIPSIRKLEGSGSYLNITMGFSAFGADIYVDEDDYERAKELLEVWEAPGGLTDTGEHSDAAPNEKDELLSKQADPRYRLAILIVRIFLILMLIGMGVVLLTGLSSLFQLF